METIQPLGYVLSFGLTSYVLTILSTHYLPDVIEDTKVKNGNNCLKQLLNYAYIPLGMIQFTIVTLATSVYGTFVTYMVAMKNNQNLTSDYYVEADDKSMAYSLLLIFLISAALINFAYVWYSICKEKICCGPIQRIKKRLKPNLMGDLPMVKKVFQVFLHTFSHCTDFAVMVVCVIYTRKFDVNFPDIYTFFVSVCLCQIFIVAVYYTTVVTNSKTDEERKVKDAGVDLYHALGVLGSIYPNSDLSFSTVVTFISLYSYFIMVSMKNDTQFLGYIAGSLLPSVIISCRSKSSSSIVLEIFKLQQVFFLSCLLIFHGYANWSTELGLDCPENQQDLCFFTTSDYYGSKTDEEMVKSQAYLLVLIGGAFIGWLFSLFYNTEQEKPKTEQSTTTTS